MTPTPNDFGDLIGIFVQIIKAVIPLLMGLAIIVFLWGIVKFIWRVGGDEKAVTEGKSFMIWSVIAFFILVSVWGIIQFFQGSLGIGSFGIPLLPQ